MARPKAELVKPELHKQVEQARKARVPKRGERVEYPVPLAPVSLIEEKGKAREEIAPTGDERWFPATVAGVEHQARTTDPDAYLALLDPDEGIPLALSVIFLRR